MKKLIWIQSIISEIEEVQELNVKFRSKFNYINENHLEIETYCTDAAISYYLALDGGKGYSVYIKNFKLKVLEHLTV